MTRHEFAAKIKVQAYERCKGHCEKCTAHLFAGKFQYDHVIADAMGGEATLKNCEVLCSACHSNKTTTEDVPRIAKAKRVERNHIGADTKSRAVIPGSKKSKFKKKLNGETVLR